MIWVVGRGGLLGAALERAVRLEPGATQFGAIWCPPHRYDWRDLDTTRTALAHDAAAFRDAARGEPWCVAWCAGRGVIGASDETMAEEWRHIEAFLGGLTAGGGAGATRGGGGTIFFASSTGAVYGPGMGRLIDESSPVAPSSAYGVGKLDHESRLARWAIQHGVALRIGRITTLVGPAQSLDKGQGLVSLMVEAAHTRRPLNIYVPLATARNYLDADDAGRVIARWLALTRSSGGVRTKIIHAPRSASIATLVRDMTDVMRRRPPLTFTSRREGHIQAGLSAYRSIVDVDADRISWKQLPVMLRQVVDGAVRAGRRAQGSRSSTTT